ncbi:MAG TPA: DUF6631 family protein [Gammaproteobacteria bacterium]|nr:DUF6631 family protein [Gammaproteobacteria bacterium]
MSEQDNNDAEVLFPDRDLVLSTGEQVTVREFRFLEGFQVEREAKPLIDQLQQLAEGGEDKPPITILDELLGAHQDLLMVLISKACDRPREWLEKLGDSDGTTVMLTFWTVNSHFFMRRLQLRMAMREALDARAGQPGISPASSQPSSTTDTDGESSGPTRSGS